MPSSSPDNFHTIVWIKEENQMLPLNSWRTSWLCITEKSDASSPCYTFSSSGGSCLSSRNEEVGATFLTC
eukprot:1157525-Pelagomonas_calceolata.AAC.1